MSLLDKLQVHRERLEELAVEKPVFQTWVKQVIGMEETVIEAENMLRLKRDPTIKKLLENAKTTVEDINKQLSTNRKLTEIERTALFNQKDWNLFFIDLFASKAKLLKATEGRLKNVIDNMKKHGY